MINKNHRFFIIRFTCGLDLNRYETYHKSYDDTLAYIKRVTGGNNTVRKGEIIHSSDLPYSDKEFVKISQMDDFVFER